MRIYSVCSGVLLGEGLTLAYALYTAFAVLALVFVLRAVRETKDRQLEEI